MKEISSQYSVKGSALMCGIIYFFNGYQYFEQTMLFWHKVLFLITENEVVTLANEAILSIENINQLYLRILLSINTIEIILIENIEFFTYKAFWYQHNMCSHL